MPKYSVCVTGDTLEIDAADSDEAVQCALDQLDYEVTEIEDDDDDDDDDDEAEDSDEDEEGEGEPKQ
jgi:hypothetical protein